MTSSTNMTTALRALRALAAKGNQATLADSDAARACGVKVRQGYPAHDGGAWYPAPCGGASGDKMTHKKVSVIWTGSPANHPMVAWVE